MTTTMGSVPPPAESSTPGERRRTYAGAVILVVVLMVLALFTFHAGKNTKEAQDKANALVAELHARGAQAPSTDMLVGLFGTDGGAICADPTSALKKSALLSGLSTGVGGTGARPILAESKAVQAELLVIKVYCPDGLPNWDTFVNSLNLEKT
jgi:hypothetical protein